MLDRKWGQKWNRLKRGWSKCHFRPHYTLMHLVLNRGYQLIPNCRNPFLCLMFNFLGQNAWNFIKINTQDLPTKGIRFLRKSQEYFFCFQSSTSLTLQLLALYPIVAWHSLLAVLIRTSKPAELSIFTFGSDCIMEVCHLHLLQQFWC